MDDSSNGRLTAANPDHSPESLFELLSDERRRLVVSTVAEKGERVSLSDLAETVAEAEAADASAVSQDHCEVVHTLLYHSHLPKLADAGVLEFDREERVVEPGPNLSSVAEVSAALPGGDAVDGESSMRIP